MTEQTKIKCPICFGNKMVMGAGYMEHKCEECDGNGWISSYEHHIHLDNNNEKEEVLAMTTIQPVKRRGRPPRVKQG